MQTSHPRISRIRPIPRPHRFGLIFLLLAGAILRVGATPVQTPPGLVAWWSGEGSAADRVGLNPGAPLGALNYAPGKVGQAFSFNGTDAGVRIPASRLLDVGQDPGFTLEFWIKPDDVLSPHPLVEWGEANSYFSTTLFISATSGTRTLHADVIDLANGDHVLQSGSDSVQAGVWQHVAMTYDKASGTLRLYRDGTVVGNAQIGTVTGKTHPDLLLGVRPAGPLSAAEHYAGLMDEMSLYRRALSASEIAAIVAAGTDGKIQTLAPILAMPPAGLIAAAGSTVTLSVTAGGTAPLSYQWLRNGVALPGATNATLTLDNARPPQSGQYTVTVTNAAGSATSGEAQLTVQ